MNDMTTSPARTQVHIRVAQDDDASRISAVLEALGYSVLRELDEGDGPHRLNWAVDRLARRHQLTSREQDMLELVLDGRTNTQISRALDISRATVKWHMHNVFAKTNTGNRESLLRLALQLGNSRGASMPASSRSASTPVSVPPKVGTRSDVSWTKAEDVTARVDFDQPRVPSADSIPSKGWS